MVWERKNGINSKYTIYQNKKEKTSFTIPQPIDAIVTTKKNKLFHALTADLKDAKIKPEYSDGVKGLAYDIERVSVEIGEIRQKWEFVDKFSDKKVKKSWVVAEGRKEEFSKEDWEAGRKIFEETKIIDKILDTAELVVVAQRPKMALFLILSLSSFLPKPSHSIITAPPGKSKSSISDVIFKLFPNELKIEIGKDSTPASLYNLTKYEEGSNILNDKLIRLGDWGDLDEQKEYAAIRVIFKELMSEGHISRNITVKDEKDENITKQVVIDNVGSIFYTSIEEDGKTEYSSRAITFSPDDNSAVKEAIHNYIADDLRVVESEREFERERPKIAASIMCLYQEIKRVGKECEGFRIVNPFAKHMDKHFEIWQSSNQFRDFNHIKSLPKVITMVSIKKRDIWVHKETGDAIILVTPKDYLYTLKIIEEPILVMISDIPSSILSYSNLIEKQYVASYKRSHLYTYDHLENKDKNTRDNDTAWEEVVAGYPNFTARDIQDKAGTGNSEVNRMLSKMVKVGALFRRKIGIKYIYYPTDIFENFDPLSSILAHKAEDLEIGSEIGKEIVKIYNEIVERLGRKGYERRSVSCGL